MPSRKTCPSETPAGKQRTVAWARLEPRLAAAVALLVVAVGGVSAATAALPPADDPPDDPLAFAPVFLAPVGFVLVSVVAGGGVWSAGGLALWMVDGSRGSVTAPVPTWPPPRVPGSGSPELTCARPGAAAASDNSTVSASIPRMPEQRAANRVVPQRRLAAATGVC